MPINLQGSGNIAEGWGAAPKLDAPALGPLVASILANRLARDKMTQENIADTIKNAREERQSAQYLDAMKAAGLVPQDYDAGGLGGAKLGMDLATRIQHQNELAAREEHYRAMEARPTGRGSRGGSGGGGGGSVDQTYPETIWDEQGREWRKGPGGRLIPMTPPKKSAATGGVDKTADIAKTVKERLELQDQFDMLEKDRKTQEAADITAGKAAVPFKQSDLYNLTRNRLKQLDAVPGMPSTDPAIPQRAPAETGDALNTSKVQPTTGGADKNLANGYGNDATSMSADDVRAAYRSGNMTREEAAARLRQLGLKD